jgi:hypothetical protein
MKRAASHTARDGRRSDDAGVVYVEFLLAFPPVFLVFLGFCQFALIDAARLVVQHAATRAARAAVVVLEDDPAFYDNAPRGAVYIGRPAYPDSQRELTDRLGITVAGAATAPPGSTPLQTLFNVLHGTGARVAAIRSAAYAPLSGLAPAAFADRQEGLDRSFAVKDLSMVASYNRAAAVVSLVDAPGSFAPAPPVIAPDGDVTVRVTYLYTCSVPLVRMLMCGSRDDLTGAATADASSLTAAQTVLRFLLGRAESPSDFDAFSVHGERFTVLVGEATLPNQGAAYETAGAGQ